MITGQKTITLDWRDWVRGMTTSEETSDGGYGPNSRAFNLIAQPGTLCMAGPNTDASTNLTDEIIAGTFDTEYNGDDALFVDASKAFYSWNGTTLTKQVTGTTNTYTQGTTMIVPFQLTANANPTYYISTGPGTGGDIAEWNGTTTLNEDWWSGATHLNQGALQNTAWRPLIVWENQLWIGDKNELHSVDAGENVTTPLTLNKDQSITALGIDKGTGKLLIGTTTGTNVSGVSKGDDKILLYDGSSPKVDRVTRVNGLVTAFKNLAGSTYVFYNNKMGLWTGRGIKFLREFNFTTGDSADLAYPHKIASIDDTMYIVDGQDVIAYGPVIGGQSPVFYPAYRNNVAPQGDINSITTISSTEFGVSHTTAKFYTFDVTDVSEVLSGGGRLRTRKYYFDRNVIFKGVRLFFHTLPSAGSSNIFTFQYTDDQDQSHVIKTVSTADIDTNQLILDLQGTDTYPETSTMRFDYIHGPSTSTNVCKLSRMVIYYDVVEE